MKALVYQGIETLAICEVPDPVCKTGEDLVRVEAAGICGSDMHAYLGHDTRRSAPLILGHEAAGTIVEGPRAGERVTINPLLTCGNCPACNEERENLCPTRQILSMQPREGTFAQLVAVPSVNLINVPQTVSFQQAALAEPIAVSWHAVKLGLRGLSDRMAASALVLGGGAIGLAAALALRARGVAKVAIVEPNRARAAYLSARGETVLSHAEGDWQLIVDAVGYAQTRATASALTQPGGVIVHIGLGEDAGGLDIRRMTLQEITFIGTYTYTAEDFRNAAGAMFSGQLGALDWTDMRTMDDGAAAFRDIRANAVAAPKTILSPWT